MQLGALEQCEHRHRHRQQEQRDAAKGERSCSRPEHRLHHVQLRERRLRIACDARAEAVAAAAALDTASQPRKRLRVSQMFFVPRTLSFAALAEARLAQLLLLASRISESVIGSQQILPALTFVLPHRQLTLSPVRLRGGVRHAPHAAALPDAPGVRARLHARGWLNQSLLPPCNLFSHGVYNIKARTERFTQPRTLEHNTYRCW